MAKPADYVVDNDTGANVRTDLNNLFEAIRQNNGYGSEPTTKYNYMWYANTAGSSPKMSFYKSDATNRVEFISLANGNFFGPNGSAGDPSYTFTNSASTGFYRSASNQIGVSNNSVNTALFKTTGTEIKGKLEVIPTTGGATLDIKTNNLNNQDAAINLVADTTHTTGGLSITRKQSSTGDSHIIHKGTGTIKIDTDDEADIQFFTDSSANSEERLTIRGAGANKGSIISHDNTRNILQNTGFAFMNSSGTSDNNFELLSLVKKGNGLGPALFINMLSPVANNANVQEFQYNSSFVGSVTLTGSGTQTNFNGNTSDYRLKENIVALSDGISRLKNLNPIRFNYKTLKEETFDGFIAHELQEVVPVSVTGTKDEVDSEGNPKYQAIDMSKVIPLIVGALKDSISKIETLEAKVAVLEGS